MSLHPIAYWRKPTPTAWPDASGNGYNAVMIAGPTVVAGPPGGGADGGILLDGSTQYGQGPLVPQGNYFSLVAWFKTSSASVFQRLLSNRDSPTVGGFDLYIDDGQHGVTMYTPGGNFFSGDTAGSLADGNWHMAGYTTQASGGTLYVDGVAVGTAAAANTGVSTTGLVFGAITAPFNYSNKLSGVLAELAILPPLTGPQMAALYAAGANPPKQAGGGWRAWWAVDE